MNLGTTNTSNVRPPRNDLLDSEAVGIDLAQVLAESAALDNYFQHSFRQETDAANEADSQVLDNPRTWPALEWADKFILKTQQKGGHQTESSVLKLWKVCESLKVSPGQQALISSFILFRLGLVRQ